MYPWNPWIKRVRGDEREAALPEAERKGVFRSVLTIPVPVRCTPCRHGNDLLSLDGRASGTLAQELNIRIRISARALFELLASPTARLPSFLRSSPSSYSVSLSAQLSCDSDDYLDRALCLKPLTDKCTWHS